MFESSLMLFIEKAKKHPSIPKNFIDSVVLVLNRIHNDTNAKEVEIIKQKFVFNTSFIEYFANIIDLPKSSDNTIYYKNFLRLKKFKIIHQKSSDFYPNRLRLLSINPNPISLLHEEFSQIDQYLEAKKAFLHDLDSIQDKYTLIGALSIYLHYYHFPNFTKKELYSLSRCHYSVIDSNRVCLFYPKRSPLALNDSGNTFYQSVLLDEIASKLFLYDKNLFTNLDTAYIYKQLSSYQKMVFYYMSSDAISIARKNHFLFSHTPVEYSIKNKSLRTPMLCFNEIKAIFPQCSESGIGQIESKLINKASLKASSISLNEENDDDDFMEDNSEIWWSYSDMFAFKELLKPQKSIHKSILENALKKLDSHKEQADTRGDIHSKMIFEFLYHLVIRLDGKHKIRQKTFKNYFSTLRVHLFNKVKNLANPQNYEIRKIIQYLENNGYKKKTVFKIKYLIRRFYRFHSHNGINIDIALNSYSKSLVFDFEIDSILEELEIDFRLKHNFKREGKWVRLQLLQQKVLVLLTFYTGMRKKEILSRLWKDFMLFGNEIIVDVNNEGMKPLGWNLKTRNAKRKISVKIPISHHLELIKEWYDLRSSTSKSGYLFVTQKSNGFPKVKEPLPESIIEIFNTIIAEKTGRYCTFHSLRHSFATYAFLEILRLKQNVPYAIIELAVKLGHETPETTINTYVHYDVVQLLQMDISVPL